MADNNYSKEDTAIGCKILSMAFIWIVLATITAAISFFVLAITDNWDYFDLKLILLSVTIPTIILFVVHKFSKLFEEDKQTSSDMDDEVEYTQPLIKPTYEIVITTSASSAPQEQTSKTNNQPKTCEHCGSHEFTLKDNCYVCDYCRSEYPE